MNQKHASDLSPAQSLIEDLKTVHKDCEHINLFGLFGERPFERVIIELFSRTLEWCHQETLPSSWQRRRLYALLSPMYLEVMVDLKGESSSSIQELLSVAPNWSKLTMLDDNMSCEICAQARIQAYHHLITLLAEMIQS